jgi:PAS domain S-box-containing protein
VINAFYKSLSGFPWSKPEEDSFVGYMLRENRALISKLDAIKETLKTEDYEARKAYLIPQIRELMDFNEHYLKKENILFPYLEKKQEKFNGLAIMWALHDEVRAMLKRVLEALEEGDVTEGELNKEIGSLFFAMHGLIKKEQLILFPAAGEVITEAEWRDMHRQSLEYGFPFIEKPQLPEEIDNAESFGESCLLKTETGTLSLEQVLMVFNTLPVDMTVVDENDRVRFFNRAKDRLFPRSPAVIGRDVAKCHPPESVHVVHRIIEAFRAGKQDKATFWIDIRGRKIMIQYFALRDSEGSYRGVLEVSQDISDIIEIKGERRLLHWEKE